MNISVFIIPHEEQRYQTCGDWIFNDDFSELTIYVSSLGNWKYESLVAVHEQHEAMLCRDRGITQKEVDDFDIEHPELIEPGDDKRAPYYKEHYFATICERMLAAELGVDWNEYDKAIQNLFVDLPD